MALGRVVEAIETTGNNINMFDTNGMKRGPANQFSVLSSRIGITIGTIAEGVYYRKRR